jgi:ribosome-binding ATPase YchF (GTP1/OBG family)
MSPAKLTHLDDISTINTELALSDLDTVERALIRVSKSMRGGDKEAAQLKISLDKVLPVLSEGSPARCG